MPVTVKVNGAANSLVHKGSNGVSPATIPDVCKTPSPGGPVPIPYPNISQSMTLAKGTTTVKADGMMIAIKGSEFSLSNGDNAGVAGGVKSSTFMKESTWILYSFDVKMDGKNACRLSDKKFQNHENTVNLAGELQPPNAVDPPKDLEEIAKCCQLAIDCDSDNKGVNCTARGTKKHKCCENAINKRKAQTNSDGTPKWSNVEPEAYHPETATMNASRLDVQVKTGNRVTHIYDFKFNCTKDPEISEEQRKKYQKRFTGAAVICVDVGRGANPAPDKSKCPAPKPEAKC